MSQVLVEPDPARRNGFALIRITGAAAAAGDPKFRIQRPDEQAGFLGNEGWQPAETLLQPDKFWVDGADLVLEIGPAVVDLVEDGTVGFSLPSAQLSRTVIWPVLQPSRGTGGRVFQAIPKTIATPVIGQATGTAPSPQPDQPNMTIRQPLPVEPVFVPRPVEVAREIPAMALPEPPVLPPPRPAVQPVVSPVVPERQKPSGWMPVFIALLLLALVAGGAWYYLTNQNRLAAAPAPQTAGQAAPSPAPVASAAPAAGAADCDASPLPALFQCEKDPAKLYTIGEQRMQAGKLRDALQIFETAAQDGNGAAALALASLYDPATFQASEVVTHSDVAEAARYYRMAVNDGSSAATQPRSQLYQLLQQRAAQGDIQAPLILNDFWR